MSPDYLAVVLVTLSIYAILAVSLNIVAGYAGQPNLAQGAFFGIGAYFTAVLSAHDGWQFWATIPVAVLATAFAGLILGTISLRLREDFLAVTTIGLNFVVVAMFQYVPFFGGAMGIYGIPLPSIGSHQFGNADFLVLGMVFLLIVAGISWYVERTWFGAALLAIKDDEGAAAATGIPVAPYKIAAFVLSAGLGGLAGALYAPFLSAVTPTSFGFSESVVILAMLMFGGIGVIAGAVAGAVVLGALPEMFRFISDYRLLTFGAILVLMLRFQPQGLLGEGSVLVRLGRWVVPRAGRGTRPRNATTGGPDGPA